MKVRKLKPISLLLYFKSKLCTACFCVSGSCFIAVGGLVKVGWGTSFFLKIFFLAEMGFKHVSLQSNFKCSGWLEVSNFTRPRIPDRRSSTRIRMLSRCFGQATEADENKVIKDEETKWSKWVLGFSRPVKHVQQSAMSVKPKSPDHKRKSLFTVLDRSIVAVWHNQSVFLFYVCLQQGDIRPTPHFVNIYFLY